VNDIVKVGGGGRSRAQRRDCARIASAKVPRRVGERVSVISPEKRNSRDDGRHGRHDKSAGGGWRIEEVGVSMLVPKAVFEDSPIVLGSRVSKLLSGAEPTLLEHRIRDCVVARLHLIMTHTGLGSFSYLPLGIRHCRKRCIRTRSRCSRFTGNKRRAGGNDWEIHTWSSDLPRRRATATSPPVLVPHTTSNNSVILLPVSSSIWRRSSTST
jgi:hypothetical protein